jgi:ribosomal protein S18 acetylase RimI-like enzyme
MELRPTTDTDLETVMTWIRNEEENRLWGGPGVRFPYTLKNIKQDIRFGDRATYSMIDEQHNLCGIGQILEKSSERIHLARIIVGPVHRGKGFGEKLCRLLIEEAVEIYGKRTFSLFVYENNLPAVRTYEKLGFKASTPPAGTPDLEEAVYMVLPHYSQ